MKMCKPLIKNAALQLPLWHTCCSSALYMSINYKHTFGSSPFHFPYRLSITARWFFICLISTSCLPVHVFNFLVINIGSEKGFYLFIFERLNSHRCVRVTVFVFVWFQDILRGNCVPCPPFLFSSPRSFNQPWVDPESHDVEPSVLLLTRTCCITCHFTHSMVYHSYKCTPPFGTKRMVFG